MIYGLELSLRLNSMESSRSISRVTCLYGTNVSRTISVIIIIRDLFVPHDSIRLALCLMVIQVIFH